MKRKKINGWFAVTAIVLLISLTVGFYLHKKLSTVQKAESEYLSAPKCYEDSRCREVIDALVIDISPSRYTTTAPDFKENPIEVTVSAYSLDIVLENDKTLKLEVPLTAPAEKIALSYEVNILAYPDKNFVRDNLSDQAYVEVELWDEKATYIITQGWAIPTFSHPTIVARKTEESFRDWNVFSSILVGLFLLISFWPEDF